MRILLVEDEIKVGNAVSEGLQAEGYQITWAQTGRKVTDAARSVDRKLATMTSWAIRGKLRSVGYCGCHPDIRSHKLKRRRALKKHHKLAIWPTYGVFDSWNCPSVWGRTYLQP